MNALDALKLQTIVVADSGDVNSITKFHPQDVTTNPSLILKAVNLQKFRPLIDKSIHHYNQWNKRSETNKQYLFESLCLYFAIEILQMIPGRVSIEINSEFSFDCERTVESARRIITQLEQKGIDKGRILIKIAATWEGMQAAKILQQESINCNITLIFSLIQSIVCFDNKVKLISPFVGRVLDWHKQQKDFNSLAIDNNPDLDPGVSLVRKIYQYARKNSYQTEIMGASFRNKQQICSLAGCDLLTISPDLLEELKKTPKESIVNNAININRETLEHPINLDEKSFRYYLNEDAMASEKLAEGIRLFNKDVQSLLFQLSTFF